MNRKLYAEPEVEIVGLCITDVITTSDLPKEPGKDDKTQRIPMDTTDPVAE